MPSSLEGLSEKGVLLSKSLALVKFISYVMSSSCLGQKSGKMRMQQRLQIFHDELIDLASGPQTRINRCIWPAVCVCARAAGQTNL